MDGGGIMSDAIGAVILATTETQAERQRLMGDPDSASRVEVYSFNYSAVIDIELAGGEDLTGAKLKAVLAENMASQLAAVAEGGGWPLAGEGVEDIELIQVYPGEG
jgi:hypothetical protein